MLYNANQPQTVKATQQHVGRTSWYIASNKVRHTEDCQESTKLSTLLLLCARLLKCWSHDMAASLPVKQLTGLLFFSQVCSPLSYLHLYICFVCWDSLTAYGLFGNIIIVVWAMPETLYRRRKCRLGYIQTILSALLRFLSMEKVVWTPLHNVSSIVL